MPLNTKVRDLPVGMVNLVGENTPLAKVILLVLEEAVDDDGVEDMD